MPEPMIDILDYNRRAWDIAVARYSQWTVPVGPEVTDAARQGDWQIVLTPTQPVPRDWFPAEMRGVRVLCLAGAGGQQGPTLAAAGADVTVFDNSPAQLAQDRKVATRDGLALRTVQGDMADLSVFADGSFDLIVHPVSNLFVPDVRPVWREAARVLAMGGELLAGFCNPAMYLFDMEKADAGLLEVRHKLPYADVTHLRAEELQQLHDELQPLEFGHMLTTQIGGQTEAGLAILGLYEDGWAGQAIAEYMPNYIATRARKLKF
jgi:SAM-dependent methyltransferase